MMNEAPGLGPMPVGRKMEVVDEKTVSAPLGAMFAIARQVEYWPAHLSHYRHVRFRERRADGGGLVSMAADRPFGLVNWPTWWLSEMSVDESKPSIRFRHVEGITKGMDVEWTFTPRDRGVTVRIVHVWDGPAWPVIGELAATLVIGPVFIHGIASRTLDGLARVAEREATLGGGRP